MSFHLRNNRGAPHLLPASRAFAVTPSDTTDQLQTIGVGSNDLFSRAFQVQCRAAGAISVITIDGDTLTFTGCTVGEILPVIVKRVRTTGTVSADIVGLY